MAWNEWFKKAEPEEKLNPVQPEIAYIEGGSDIGSREIVTNYTAYYEYLEIVNRGVNMIVDDVSEISLKIGDSIPGLTPVVGGMRQKSLTRILNKEPNPFQDISSFKRNLVIDYILDGNIFIYFDGAYIYHQPANHMTINPDEKAYVHSYTFEGHSDFTPREIIHIKENSFYSIYRGISRLRPARRTMALLGSMRTFQDNFFKNGAVPGLVIKSPNTLSEKIKERMIQSWMTRYKPDAGGRRPMVLDGGLELDTITDVNFREMAFEESILENEKEVLKVLGIPPILMDGGNNANIRPNHRIYYLETILPIVRKINFALERFFGYEITEDISNIPALQPELSDQAQYYSTLVNSGIITPNEARVALGEEAIDGHDDLRIPENIAGSASNPSEGGRPTEDTDE